MNYIIHNGELYHYGVKGMKWGVIKKQQPETKMKKASRVLGKVSVGSGVAGAAALVGSLVAGAKGHDDVSRALVVSGYRGIGTAAKTGAVSAGLAIGDRAVRTKRAKKSPSETLNKPVTQVSETNKTKKGKIATAAIVGGAAGTVAVGAVARVYINRKVTNGIQDFFEKGFRDIR